MNVAFLTEYFRPFEIGGAERSTERLGLELLETGTHVCVITPNYGAAAREDLDGLRIHRLPFPQSLRPGQLVRRVWSGNPVIHALHALRILRVLRSEGASLVHVQNSGMVVAGAIAAALAGLPLVVTIRDLAYLAPEAPAPARGWKWRFDAAWAGLERRLKRRALERAQIVFVSRALQELYVERGIVDPGRARVIYNIGPSPGTRPVPSPDERTVLFVGKLSAGKGLGVLYAAAELVRRQVPDVKFELVGVPGVGFEPPPSSVAAAFTLRGRLDSAEVQQTMLRRSVLVSPSVWPEPLSRVLLEAMAARLPIVATDVGGTAEVVEHESSGLLVPPADAAALASALVRVLQSPDLAARLAARAAVRLTSTFSAAVIVPQVLAAYRDAVASR